MSGRLFVALELPEAVRSTMAAELAALPETVRPVLLQGLHITLRFLGETPDDVAAALEADLRDAVGAASPFYLEVRGGGAFPDRRRARVVWAGVGGDVPALRRLADRVDRVCDALGFTPESRAFVPHVTLGRAVGTVPEGWIRDLERTPARADWQVHEVALMRSDFAGGPGPARYTRVAAFPMAESS